MLVNLIVLQYMQVSKSGDELVRTSEATIIAGHLIIIVEDTSSGEEQAEEEDEAS